MLTAILLFATVLPAQKADVPIVGRWKLKSVTVNGTATKPKDMTAFLKKAGGVKADMVYKFEEQASDGDCDCSLNRVGGMYEYGAKTKSLGVWGGEGDKHFEIGFDAKIIDKNLELEFEEFGKVVKLLFSPD